MKIKDFLQRKIKGEKISMVTCYDFWSARILNQSKVDVLLVGDSLSMVMYGHETTIPADIEMMALHTRAVNKGAPDKFIVADMPFLSTRKGTLAAMNGVEELMKAGAHAIKIEGQLGHQELISHIVESGVPVMGHLGLTPQSVHQLSGYSVQGKEEARAEEICTQAKKLEEAGCFSLVLECIPRDLTATIQKNLSIPVIGIGAGAEADGQVLVLHDLLGLNNGFQPKFLRRYAQGFEMISSAVNQFHQDVQSGQFPSEKESYS